MDASRGANLELTAVSLALENPRARVSRTEARGKVFSALGEFIWYLAGSDALEFIEYYIPEYAKDAENGRLWGAYGPRLIGPPNQFQNVVQQLASKPSSRRSVIQLFDAQDLLGRHKEVPCTCTLQFLVRDGCLDVITHMRSNDAVLGLPHDIFSFTMFQELVSRSLGVEVGTYRHIVGSLHIYEDKLEQVYDYLKEGYQSTRNVMPDMPSTDPWGGVARLIDAERRIRETGEFNRNELDSFDPYWRDFVVLLLLYRAKKDKAVSSMNELRAQIASKVYSTLVDEFIERAGKG